MRTAGEHNERSTADRIYAILEVNEPNRMTYEQIVLELDERFGVEPKPATVVRAMHRLVEYGFATSVIELYDDYDRAPRVGRVQGVRTPYGYRTYRRMLLGVA